MRILLTCCLGMSTSLLVEMMNETCKKQGKSHKIWCVDENLVDCSVMQCDILLLGPQLKHVYKRFHKSYGKMVPIAMIDQRDYGLLDGEKVLEKAERIYNEFHRNGNYIDVKANEEEQT